MLTLLNEIHFWSAQDDLNIKDTDYGAFKYNDRKEDNTTDNLQSKKLYSERRNYHWNLTNKRPCRLRDKLRELEEQISQNKVIYLKWAGRGILQLMLCTGLLVTICVNIHSGDVQKISFDKYLTGKLQSSSISDVLMTRSHLLCTYNDTRITLVHFTKRSIRDSFENVPIKLSRLEPRVVVSELAGPSGRRLDRRMSSSVGGDRVLIWWRCTRDDVYPWSPLVKDQDRANIHIYTLYGTKLELLCYKRTEFELLHVAFDNRQPNIIHCIEQKLSRRGTVSVEVSTYEIVRNRLQQQMLTSIPLQTHVSCHALNPDGQKIVLGCIDGSVVLFDCVRGVTSVVKAAFIPTLVSWHPGGAVLIVANERCQMQWFDLALSCIKSQTISEDVTPVNILDLSSYFKQQPSLLHMLWMSIQCGNDAQLLLVFERGPLALLRLVDGGALTPDSLVATYIRGGHVELALSTLQALDWESSGATCLASLQHVVSHLFRMRLTPNIEQQLQRALGIFYAPLRPLSASTRTDFGDQVADITRRFFHVLIRHRLYEKAFCLAIDIGDHDLFMDLYQCARQIPDTDMAVAALTRANELLERTNSDSEDSHSLCSRSECSQCSDSDSVVDEAQPIVPRPRVMDTWTIPEPSPLPPLPTVATSTSMPPPPPLPLRPRTTFPEKSFSVTNQLTLPEKSFFTSNQIMFSENSFSAPNQMILPEKSFSASNQLVLPEKSFSASNQMIFPEKSFPTSNQLVLPEKSFSTSNQMVSPEKCFSTSFMNPIMEELPTPLTPLLLTSSIESKSNFTNSSTMDRAVRFKPPILDRRVDSDAYSPNYFPTNLSYPKLCTAPTAASAVHVHRTVSMNIPPTPTFVNASVPAPVKVNVPLNTLALPSYSISTETIVPSKSSGEKNVKFSDTVTAFIVPEIPRSEKLNQLKGKRISSQHRYVTDPKRELADSLPLCHPNDDYLKDFTPISNHSEDEDVGTKIKVVHFGMV